MSKESIEKLVETGRRSRVEAAAKLGYRPARKALKMAASKQPLTLNEMKDIVRAAGFADNIAEVMLPMSIVRTVVPEYFESYEELKHTDFHSAAISLIAGLERWLKDPSEEAATQVFSLNLALHRSLLAIGERAERDDSSDDVYDEDEEEDERDFEEFDPPSDQPEERLYKALSLVAQLTTPFVEVKGYTRAWLSIHALTWVRYTMMTDRNQIGAEDDMSKNEYNKTLTVVREALAHDMLKLD